jgi:hypothetical protein
MREMSLFLQISSLFLTFSAWSTGRSPVENDRPPSFQGAPDWWESARFLELSLNFSRFPVTKVYSRQPPVTHTVGPREIKRDEMEA